MASLGSDFLVAVATTCCGTASSMKMILLAMMVVVIREASLLPIFRIIGVTATITSVHGVRVHGVRVVSY